MIDEVRVIQSADNALMNFDTTHPVHAVAAASHDNPYPWYSTLRATSPLVYETKLKLWLATTASAVHAAFNHPHFNVRPTHEPVPPAIANSPAGEVFSHLVRMNDGLRHNQPKLALERALATLDLNEVGHLAAQQARLHRPVTDGAQALAHTLNASMFQVPVTTVAGLLGFAPAQWPEVAQWMGDFVNCLSPLSSADQLTAASTSAQALLARLGALVAQSQPQAGQLLHSVLEQAATCGWQDQRAVLCNLVGLMSQTYEATAGLIGNTWVALAQRPALLAELVAESRNESRLVARVHTLVDSVCSFDAPIQNTRRFAMRDTELLGKTLPEGSVVLLLLGSANRDTQGSPLAGELQTQSAPPPYFSFGRGVHACPGRALALTIAASAITQLLLSHHGLPMEHLAAMQVSYRPSVNARIPLFSAVL